MRRERWCGVETARRALGTIAAGLLMTATVASAQAPSAVGSPWRLGASTGGYVATSALIKAEDTDDTRLSAGPAFSFEPQYDMIEGVSVWGNVLVAFGTLRLGSSIQPDVVGPSDQVALVGTTAGVMLTTSEWFGEHMQPTLRVGGGLKWYRFDLTGADNQVRPTTDLGVGLRGVSGLIDGTVEVRYLLSSFDQEKLPTRGITPQDQRQHDFVLAIGIGIRP